MQKIRRRKIFSGDSYLQLAEHLLELLVCLLEVVFGVEFESITFVCGWPAWHETSTASVATPARQNTRL